MQLPGDEHTGWDMLIAAVLGDEQAPAERVEDAPSVDDDVDSEMAVEIDIDDAPTPMLDLASMHGLVRTGRDLDGPTI